MRRFTTARGTKRAPSIEVDGFGETPAAAAKACADAVMAMLARGYGGGTGRVEIAR
jgi:hypothetical protein